MPRIIFAVFIAVFSALPVSAEQVNSIFSKEIRQEAQEALSYYGYDAGPTDGIFGSRTAAAIRAYQVSIGGQPTGNFSRAGIGNLLQRYREDRRNQAERAEEFGLPAPVSAVIGEMAKSCETAPEKMISRLGFLQKADLNNDGIADYLVDGSAAGCSYLCGAANCQVSILVSTSRGYRISEFLGGGITPRSFNCLSNGQCEFSR